MKLNFLIISAMTVSLFACSKNQNKTESPTVAPALSGGTSSGGPQARIKIYAHCVANDGLLTFDLASNLSLQQAQFSSGLNACANAWTTFIANQEQDGSIVGLAISSGNQKLFIGSALSTANNIGPHVNFSGTWTDGSNVTPMVCSLYDGYQSMSGCAAGETEILSCSNFGTSICIQEN